MFDRFRARPCGLRFAVSIGRRAYLVFLVSMVCLVSPAPAEDDAGGEGRAEDVEAPLAEDETVVGHSLGHQLLYYIPNRLLDVIDVFRIRGRVGPGLAIDIRATDRLSFFAGRYHSAYIGLPGPRHPNTWRSPFGMEEWQGIYFLGIDATDATDEGPEYSPAEVNLGAQVLIVGVDLGIEPVELGDFLAGLIFRDPIGDDL